jgi:hypothetical protein
VVVLYMYHTDICTILIYVPYCFRMVLLGPTSTSLYCSGMPTTVSEFRYIEYAHKLECYGHEFHPAKVRSSCCSTP